MRIEEDEKNLVVFSCQPAALRRFRAALRLSMYTFAYQWLPQREGEGLF